MTNACTCVTHTPPKVSINPITLENSPVPISSQMGSPPRQSYITTEVLVSVQILKKWTHKLCVHSSCFSSDPEECFFWFVAVILCAKSCIGCCWITSHLAQFFHVSLAIFVFNSGVLLFDFRFFSFCYLFLFFLLDPSMKELKIYATLFYHFTWYLLWLFEIIKHLQYVTKVISVTVL